MTQRTIPMLTLALALAFAAPAALAGATAQEVERLAKDLTPVGAERAGNKDGSIPAWDGGLAKAPAGFDAKKGYADPFGAEKPLFTITSQNAAQYAEKLSPGQLAMLKKYPSLRLAVYPGHRTAALPQAAYDDVRKNAAAAELTPGGNGVAHSGTSTVPFPFPKAGEDLLWNHNFRWRGGSVERESSWYVVQPSGANFRVATTDRFVFENAGYLDTRRDNMNFVWMGYYRAPATLEGTILLVWDTIDQGKEARSGWLYNAGQRRVRRIPDLCCDYSADGTEGLRFTDQYDAWNGTTDRYTWKLVGKKEMYIPYNVYRLTDKSLKPADVLKPGHVNSDLLRYELHRVWVAEGTLKAGKRHVIAKRVMYFDEDTFQVAAADLYDARGQLWRYQETFAMQYYDVNVPWYSGIGFYDLNSGAYTLAFASFEEKSAPVFGVRGKLADFQPDALRRMGTK
jgi:hypothetical protein